MKKWNRLIFTVILLMGTLLLLGSCDKTPKVTEPDPTTPSDGLEFAIHSDGTAYVKGVGTCTDPVILIPSETPDGIPVTVIGDGAFRQVSGIQRVIIPEGVTVVAPGAFKQCKDLISVEFPDSLLVIHQNAFVSCEQLTEADLPPNLIYLGSCAFSHTNISSVTLPDSLRYLEYAYGGCEIRNTVYLPESLYEIQGAGFSDSSETKYNNGTYVGTKDNPYYALIKVDTDAAVDSFTIHPDTKIICPGMFAENEGYKGKFVEYNNGYYIGTEDNPYFVLVSVKANASSLAIHDHTKIIDYDAIGPNITDIQISALSELEYVYRHAFNSMNASEVNLQHCEKLRYVGNDAFNNCSKLQKVSFPENVAMLGTAFFHCYPLKEIHYEGNSEKLSAFFVFNNQFTYYDYSPSKDNYLPKDCVIFCDGSILSAEGVDITNQYINENMPIG